MKKILHLICNSHVDPVWQWDWDEGACAALSTFYAACNLLDKYDFVFCHNEVILYEYIEKYDPELFKRIQDLVAQGKWKIMGGWYCQPDCYVPSGESFIRQITLGREYFGEKFNSRPTTALNFDSFGHTKGLPQILKKCGYDSYIFCRPLPEYVSLPDFVDYPHGPFLWEGYDGSQIKALRYEDPRANYTSPLGQAKEAIVWKESYYKDLDTVPVLWGVGNHGGTASEKDLEDILVLQDEKKGEWEIIHSSLEDYFATTHPTVVEKRQIFVFLKAYSSVNAIKLAHDQLENALYMSEKVCTAADIAGKYHYNKQIFKDAERVLAQIEFHDVMAGTAIRLGTDSSIRKAHMAIEQLKSELFGAYTALSRDLPKPTPGDDNVVMMNPYPYDYDDLVECELYPMGLLTVPDTMYKFTIRDLNGNVIPFQIIKEESNIMAQHRVRVIFKAHIPAFSVVSYDAHYDFVKKEPKARYEINGDVVVTDSRKTVRISAKTGLLDSFSVNGKEYLAGGASLPMSFDDNADPWGWRLHDLTSSTFSETDWPQKEEKNSLKAFRLDNSGKGVYRKLKALTILEQGDQLTQVQALFSKDESHVVIDYKIYHETDYIDVNYRVLWNEASKGLKIRFPLAGPSKYYTQLAYGVEPYAADGIENPGNRYVYVKNGENVLAIYNKSGIHSYSKKGKNLYLTFLNGAAWCAHPIDPNTPLTDPGRFVPYVEEGAHEFFLRIRVNKPEECERYAQEFCQPVYYVNSYPHGDGKNVTKNTVTVSNPNVVITAMKRRNNGTYLVRLYNGSNGKAATDLVIQGVSKNIRLGKYEFRTYVYDGKKITESADSSIY